MTGTRGSNSPVVYDLSGITVPDPVLEPYVGSNTFQTSGATRGTAAPRRDADSPSVDGPYAVPPSRGDPRSDRGDRDRDARMERERNQVSRRQPPDAMDIDPPPISERDRYGNPIAQPRAYQDRVYAEARGFPPNRSAYPQDQQMAGGYGPPPASSSYVQDSRYATSFPQSDGAPPGYVRQGQFYVPVTNDIQSGFVAPGRSQPQPYEAGPPYGQSQIQPGRDRERGPDPRDPRYGQPDFDTRDTSRYAYPSPAATVSSVDVRGRDSVTSPPAQARFAYITGSHYRVQC